jgi:hypothetical protein
VTNKKPNDSVQGIADLLALPGVEDIAVDQTAARDFAQPADLEAGSELEEAWFAEVQQRIAEVDRGGAPLIPGEQAIARARRSLADKL